MKPTDEQKALIDHDLLLAAARALSGDDTWDTYYSVDGDRIRMGPADLAAGRFREIRSARDLLTFTEGG